MRHLTYASGILRAISALAREYRLPTYIAGLAKDQIDEELMSDRLWTACARVGDDGMILTKPERPESYTALASRGLRYCTNRVLLRGGTICLSLFVN